MVNQYRLAWCGRGLGEVHFARQHVDEARFANVASSYKGELRQLFCRALLHAGTADGVFGAFDNHVRNCMSIPD